MWGLQKLTVAELEEKLLTGTSSPQTQATKPDYVKFHDDKVWLGSRASRACAVCMQRPSGFVHSTPLLAAHGIVPLTKPHAWVAMMVHACACCTPSKLAASSSRTCERWLQVLTCAAVNVFGGSHPVYASGVCLCMPVQLVTLGLQKLACAPSSPVQCALALTCKRGCHLWPIGLKASSLYYRGQAESVIKSSEASFAVLGDWWCWEYLVVA